MKELCIPCEDRALLGYEFARLNISSDPGHFLAVIGEALDPYIFTLLSARCRCERLLVRRPLQINLNEVVGDFNYGWWTSVTLRQLDNVHAVV